MGPNGSYEARDARVKHLARAYAAALLTGDEHAAEVAIRDAMDANLTTAEIDDEIIAPALWFVGELWARGEITVAEEHIATVISLRVLTLHREAQRLATTRAEHRIMLATPTGEQHVVALQMTANLLRDAGYDVVMLGADVPIDALAASAGRLQPEVVCLSSTMPGGAERVTDAIEAVQQEWPAAAFVVGGRGVSERMRSRPGIDVCRRVSEVVDAVDALVKRADLN